MSPRPHSIPTVHHFHPTVPARRPVVTDSSPPVPHSSLFLSPLPSPPSLINPNLTCSPNSPVPTFQDRRPRTADRSLDRKELPRCFAGFDFKSAVSHRFCGSPWRFADLFPFSCVFFVASSLQCVQIWSILAIVWHCDILVRGLRIQSRP